MAGFPADGRATLMARQLDALKQALLAQHESILPRWFPNGRWEGGVFMLGDLSGAPGRSLKVRKDGYWKDWASGEGGTNLLELYVQAHKIEVTAAYDQLAPEFGLNGHDRLAASPRPLTASKGLKSPKEPEQPIEMPTEAPAPRFRDPPEGVQSLFEYRDLDNRLLCVVRRIDYPDQSKDVRPWVRIGGKWVCKGPRAPKPLYNQPSLAGIPADRWVILVSGEKCVDALQPLLVAKDGKVLHPVLTWMGGDQAVHKADWSPLADRRILYWPDADESGKATILPVCELLQAQRCRVNVVAIPDNVLAQLPENSRQKADVADLIRAGLFDLKLLKRMKDAGAAPNELASTSSTAIKQTETNSNAGGKQESRSPPAAAAGRPQVPLWQESIHQFRDVADLRAEPEPVQWLWDGYLPDRETSLLFGTGKAGKSTFAQHLACHVAAGEPFLGRDVRAGRVLYITGEDSLVRVRNSLRAYVARATRLRWLSEEAGESIVRNLVVLEACGNRWKLLRQIDRSVVIAPEVGGLIDYMNQSTVPWALGIFDTASRLSDGEESNRDLAMLVGAVDVFRLTGAASLIVHHSGKGAARAGEVGMDAARGGTALAYNSRSVLQLVHVSTERGDQGMSLLDQGIASPTTAQVEAVDVPGLETCATRDLVGLLHSACNCGPTQRPRWFIRHGWLGYPILHEFSFAGTLDDARESRRQERDRMKAREAERLDIESGHRVVDAIRRITTGLTGPTTLATLKTIREVAGMNESVARRGIAWAIGGARIEMYQARAGNNRVCGAYRLAGSQRGAPAGEAT